MSLVGFVGGIFTLVGVGMIFSTARRFFLKQDFLRNSTVARGRIIAFSENREGHEPSYCPKVQFTTAAGQTVVFDSVMGSTEPPGKVGDSVSVRYRLDGPHEAEIDNFWALWGVTLVFAILGSVFLAVGMGLLTGLIPV